VIAPGYTEEALTILREKKKGKYNVIEIDSSYRPAATEVKQVFGVCFKCSSITFFYEFIIVKIF